MLPVYCCVCEIVRVEVTVIVLVALGVADGGTVSVTVNEPRELGVLVETSDKLGVIIPVADKVTGDEGLACVDGVKPNEGDACVVAVILGDTEGNTVELTKEVPVTEYDELGVRIPLSV